MKTIIYYSCNYSPIALVMAARKIGLLHDTRSLYVSDLKQLTFLNLGGIKGRLIFVGVDKECTKIYTLTGCGPKEIILRYIKSFLGLYNEESNNCNIIDCSGQANILLSLGWFLYQKNIFRSISGYIVCSLINKSFPDLAAQTENI